ncbi:MAG: elongation factor P [Thomasclavelia sp.]|jgi:elongation factor P|nr:elongation factor P [Thomasclavelia sp.]
MISVSDLRPGTTFQYDGNLFVVLDYSHNKTARAAANIKIKMKNMRTGSTTEMTFGNSEKVQRAHIDKNKMQYLYNAGESLVFMDNATYEQIEIPEENLTWEMNFLKESDEVEVTSFEGEVLGVALPINVPFKITETEPAVKGDTATGATKYATIETGYQIKVPLFIDEGEMVIVNTVDGKYQGRA